MNNVSRRTLSKTAAWSIPIVAIGVAAPASAASTPATSLGTIKWTHHDGGAWDQLSWTFNYGFGQDPTYEAKDTAVCFVVLTVDEQVACKYTVDIPPGKYHEDKFKISPLSVGEHLFTYTVTAPGFNTLFFEEHGTVVKY